jgi:hypothetical protein
MERNNLEDLGVDEMMTLKLILKIRWESVYCIRLAQDMERWRAVVSIVMKFRVA